MLRPPYDDLVIPANRFMPSTADIRECSGETCRTNPTQKSSCDRHVQNVGGRFLELYVPRIKINVSV